MPIDYSIVQPPVLTGYVRNLPVMPEIALNGVLPDRLVPDIEAVADQVTRTNRAAMFRSFDAETPIGKRDTFQRTRYTIPPIGQKTILGEWERLQVQRMQFGGQPGPFGGGGGNSPLLAGIYDEVDTNARAVQIRAELARGDVLTDGKFSLVAENGLTLDVDYALPGGNILAVSVAWTDHVNADPIADLRGMQNLQEDNGAITGAFWMSRDRVQDLLACAKVRSLATPLGLPPAELSLSQLNRILVSQDLAPVRQYNARFDVGGATTRVLPIGRVIAVPQNPGDLGYTAWGITAEALELVDANQLSFEAAPGLVAYIDREDDPVARWTKVTGTCLPVITAPEKLVVRDVV